VGNKMRCLKDNSPRSSHSRPVFCGSGAKGTSSRRRSRGLVSGGNELPNSSSLSRRSPRVTDSPQPTRRGAQSRQNGLSAASNPRFAHVPDHRFHWRGCPKALIFYTLNAPTLKYVALIHCILAAYFPQIVPPFESPV
jgi:hypothetical protein